MRAFFRLFLQPLQWLELVGSNSSGEDDYRFRLGDRPEKPAVLCQKIGNAARCAREIAEIIIGAELSWICIRSRTETGNVRR